MNPTVFYVAGGLAATPFLAIVVILAHYYLRRAAWKSAKRAGRKPPGFCPSSSSLGSAFQIVQVFYRPTTAFVIEAKLEEDVDEDDNGDPESPAKHLLRQLHRIRRGEMVDTLVVRRQ
jgi:hypothetical protein